MMQAASPGSAVIRSPPAAPFAWVVSSCRCDWIRGVLMAACLPAWALVTTTTTVSRPSHCFMPSHL